MEAVGALYVVGGVLGFVSLACSINSHFTKNQILKYSKFKPFSNSIVGNVYLEGLLNSDNPIELDMDKDALKLAICNIKSYDHVKYLKTTVDVQNNEYGTVVSANSDWIYRKIHNNSKYDYSNKLSVSGVDVTNLHFLFDLGYISTYYTNNLHIPYYISPGPINADPGSLRMSATSDCHIHKKSTEVYGILNNKSFFTVAGFYDGQKFNKNALVIPGQFSSYISELEQNQQNAAFFGIMLGVLACTSFGGGFIISQVNKQ